MVESFVNDHLTFIDKGNLLGFTLNSEHDSNSLSTLTNSGGPSFITPAKSNNVVFTRSDTRSSENASVTSGNSTVTMDTINTIETRLTALSTHMHNSDRKIIKLMKYLITTNARGQASSTTTQIGTTDSSHSKAG